MKKIVFCFICIQILTSCFKKDIVDSSVSNKDKLEVDSTIVNGNTIDIETQVPGNIKDSMAQNTVEVLPKISFSEAEQLNTVDGWKKFLTDHPEYEDKDEISDKIIRAEVDEIMKNKDTGQMPTSEKTRGGNQAFSSIIVDNNTSCDLTLRYSGTDAKKIIIPPNSEQKISLQSGQYNVAATACGHHYAGSEVLSGDYEVVYYITTVRY